MEVLHQAGLRVSTGNERRTLRRCAVRASHAPVSAATSGLSRISADFGGLDLAVTKTARFRVSKRLEAQTHMVKAEGEGFEPSKSLHP
jgi:hypothetical protein